MYLKSVFLYFLLDIRSDNLYRVVHIFLLTQRYKKQLACMACAHFFCGGCKYIGALFFYQKVEFGTFSGR